MGTFDLSVPTWTTIYIKDLVTKEEHVTYVIFSENAYDCFTREIEVNRAVNTYFKANNIKCEQFTSRYIVG